MKKWIIRKKRYVRIQAKRVHVKTNVHTFVQKTDGQMDAHIDRVTYVAGDEVTEFAVIPLNLRQVHFWYSIFEYRSVAGHLGSTRKEVHRTQKHQHLANSVDNMIMVYRIILKERKNIIGTAENR